MKKRLLLFLLFSMFFSLTFAQESVAHSDTIRLIQFSPDNSFIVTAGDDRMVRLWDVHNGSMIRAFKHGYEIDKIYIHPTGKLILTTNGRGYNCLWDPETGKAIKCFPDVVIEGFTPDGKNIVAIRYEKDRKKYAVIHLISLDTYKTTIFSHKIYTDSFIEQVSFLKDKGGVFVVNGETVLLLDAEKVSVKEKYKLKSDPGFIAFSGDQKLYVRPGSSHLFELEENKNSVELAEPLKSGKGTRIWFTDNSKNIISIFYKELTVFETDSGTVVRKIFSDDFVFNVSNDLKFIASSSDGRKLSLKNLESGDLIYNYVAEDIEEKYGYRNFLKGIKSFRQRNYIASANYFTKAIGRVNDHRVYLYRGRAFLYAGKYDKAIEDFMKDKKLDSRRSSLDLARTYAAMDNAEMAIEHLKHNFQSSYRERWSVIMQDSFFLTMKNNPVWINFWNEQVLSEADKFAVSAENSMKEGKFREALNQINSSIQQEPRNPDWYHIRAKVNLEFGKYEEAVRDFKKELQLDSKRQKEVYKNIAIVYTRKGDLATASVLLKEIVKKDSAEFHLLLDIAEVELERYNTEEAFSAIDEYIKVIPDDDEAYYVRANIAEGEEAKADIKRAILICKMSKKEVPQKYYDFLRVYQ